MHLYSVMYLFIGAPISVRRITVMEIDKQNVIKVLLLAATAGYMMLCLYIREPYVDKVREIYI